ncbi:MAG: hypothetical protein EA379_05100 [Phycisphaerales bacterium]|nr:MAG: hypothetical protein EA379_05100 [Phycisphaerales bacterium]
MRVALINCHPLTDPNHDEAPTVAAFGRAGHEAAPVAWNTEAGSDLSGFDAALLRASWDYYAAPDRFLGWIDGAARQTLLLNPPQIIAWNYHKGYLALLDAAGVPIVPTVLCRAGERPDVIATARDRGWDRGVVIKPAVGAGSWNVRRFDPGELARAQAFGEELGRERDIVIQPVAAGFADPGERSLMWIDGVWTHAIRKRPRYAGESESVVSDPPPTETERDIGELALSLLPTRPLYARLDIVRGDPTTGGPGDATLVSELELIEPSLFFFCDGGDDAADALVRATVRAAKARGGSRTSS